MSISSRTDIDEGIAMFYLHNLDTRQTGKLQGPTDVTQRSLNRFWVARANEETTRWDLRSFEGRGQSNPGIPYHPAPALLRRHRARCHASWA